MGDAPVLLPKNMELYQKYIDGEIELDEIKRIAIEKYTKKLINKKSN